MEMAKIATTIALDKESKEAEDFLRGKQFNVSGLIREYLLQKAEEVKKMGL
jgi:hypothetical protein